MSYCRHSTISDVHMFVSGCVDTDRDIDLTIDAGHFWVCAECLLSSPIPGESRRADVTLHSAAEALAHLRDHRTIGQRVPDTAIDRLQREIQTGQFCTPLYATTIAVTCYRRLFAFTCSHDEAIDELLVLTRGAKLLAAHPKLPRRKLLRTGRPLRLRIVVEDGRILWCGQGRPTRLAWPPVEASATPTRQGDV